MKQLTSMTTHPAIDKTIDARNFAMDRQRSKLQLQERSSPWDVLIIGGGATGVATALDAASRGLDVALIEKYDFGKGTSSRSTKLVHGGVRYLRQGNFTLVKDALHEREALQRNATQLVSDLQFVIPCQSWFEQTYYWLGLKLYDLLAGKSNFGSSRKISKQAARTLLPTIQPQKLRSGVLYHDGQFDDASLLIAMARTATAENACLINYVSVTGFERSPSGKLTKACLADSESGETWTVAAKCFVNAAGPFCDEVRKLDSPDAESILNVSQGVHLVLPRHFFPSEVALIVPKTDDGRVLFIIPWLQYVLIGTTDTEIELPLAEPIATKQEIDFLLETAGRYLTERPRPADVLSMFTGIRPLVKGDRSSRTASLSRDHVIRLAPSGLITITGGKWTTVRKMAEDCVDRVCKEIGGASPACRTRNLKLWSPQSDTYEINRERILTAVHEEMAMNVEDVLARRTRLLFCDAHQAKLAAPQIAQWIAEELKKTEDWQHQQVTQFNELAKQYLP